MMEEVQEKQIEEGKFFAVISYLSFLCIVTLLLKKDNKFALHHAKQGLVIFVFEVAAFLLSIIPVLGLIITVLGVLVFSLVSLWGILQALMGKAGRIPVVSNIADKIIL